MKSFISILILVLIGTSAQAEKYHCQALCMQLESDSVEGAPGRTIRFIQEVEPKLLGIKTDSKSDGISALFTACANMKGEALFKNFRPLERDVIDLKRKYVLVSHVAATANNSCKAITQVTEDGSHHMNESGFITAADSATK
jgi:hypothetical protein